MEEKEQKHLEIENLQKTLEQAKRYVKRKEKLRGTPLVVHTGPNRAQKRAMKAEARKKKD